MSRAYRIRVSESLRRTLQAEDEVCSQIELLEVLPPEQMADLLREELKQRGFAEEDGGLVRRYDGVTTRIDPACGEVVLTSEAERDVAIEAEREGVAYDDIGPAERVASDAAKSCRSLFPKLNSRPNSICRRRSNRPMPPNWPPPPTDCSAACRH